MKTWNESLAQANTDRTLQRGRSGLNRKTQYVLGKGGFEPLADLTPKCDCSGFVAWAIGIPRELPPGSDRWLQTDTYWVGGGEVGAGLFDRVTEAEAKPGDIYVFPDSNGRQGHMGIISRIDDRRPTHVIHCSAGNFRRTDDAIQETDPSVFAVHPRVRIVRVDYAALREQFGLAPSDDLSESIKAEVEALPKSAGELKSPLLASDATLRHILAGTAPALIRIDGPVGGAGAVQDALNLLAATNNAIPRIDLGDQNRHRGNFGKQTEAAVIAFQRASGLRDDGEVGPKTLLKLDEALTGLNLNEELSPNLGNIETVIERDAHKLFRIGRTDVFELAAGTGPKAYFFESGMTINADGSPRAYHPNGSPPGLDKLANAGRPGKWWGIATDSSQTPLKQGPGDPFPGFYISTTAWVDPSKRAGDPARYVNSEKINFIVLANGMAGGAKLGDLATVIFRGRVAHAICADIGPAEHLGEGSIALAEALGIPSNPRHGGTGHEVVYVVFPGSKIAWPLTPSQIDQRASELFARWGGLGQVIACFGA
jgi:hypothetical protein